MRSRLSVFLFLQFAIPGAWVPLCSLWLELELKFSPSATGAIGATHALGAIFAPLVAGQIADRWVSPERCIAVCCLVSSLLLWFVASLTEPVVVFWTSLAIWIVLAPALSLGTAYCMGALPNPERHFGPVRLWGTFGWMVSLWLMGYWLTSPVWLRDLLFWLRSHDPVGRFLDGPRLASVFALAAGVYTLTLPRYPRRTPPRSWLAPLAAVQLLRDPAFAAACASGFGMSLTMAYAGQNLPLLLKHLGVAPEWIPPAQTFAQVVEMLNLAVLPMFLLRFAARGTMTLGLLLWTCGLAVWASGGPLGFVIAALAMWGMAVCCYFVAAQVFVNYRAPGDIRASAQGLLTVANGLGMLAGYLLSGWIRQWSGGDFQIIFGVAAGISLGFTLIFLAGFRETPPD